MVAALGQGNQDGQPYERIMPSSESASMDHDGELAQARREVELLKASVSTSGSSADQYMRLI